ncbi:universal stress protein [Pandoraea sputorum]|uniref:universal stress protein n=1 Tax=Pandoraea sputorum TaxID=93222 RepID=UPI001CD54667|nr:universal stress protein [Pandoraea sputorum]
MRSHRHDWRRSWTPPSSLLSPQDATERWRRILVAVDPRGASRQAVAYATRLCSASTHVLVLGFFEHPYAYMMPHSRTPADVHAAFDELRHDEASVLSDASGALACTGAKIETRLLGPALGNREIAAAIARVAQAWRADLIIVGAATAHGIFATLATNVSVALSRYTHRAILIVPAHAGAACSHSPQRILFGIDGSDASLNALRVGMRLAPPYAELLALYIEDRGVDLANVQQFLLEPACRVSRSAKALKRAMALLSKPGKNVRIETRVSHTRLMEDVAQAIVRESRQWGADLIVTGARDRHGMFAWIDGHENERLARAVDRPLLVVPAHGDARTRP